ncbi:ArsR/SmtB family transcription factor [Caballeronia glebae]|jgi:DNA-binding transcriptional ArsR family regulator|uniref:Transcription regulator ArsR n=1 Tax=Caballeronia glebae TaxID=1777143 RepID=A0A158ASR2_9BURK|nr:helix-turn-helix domain-containing protein [Caballeronia glebae]SAK60998.1 transcription regulator ArsR [Caballeronia glebae]
MNANLIHKALASPVRRDILAWLKTPADAFAQERIEFGQGVPSNAIQARSGLSQSTMSAHLSLLVDAGLLVSTRVGPFVLMSRNEEVIRAFVTQMHSSL